MKLVRYADRPDLREIRLPALSLRTLGIGRHVEPNVWVSHAV